MKKLIILFLSLFVIWGNSSAFERNCAWRDVFPSRSLNGIERLSPEVLSELKILVLASCDKREWGRLVNDLSRKECVRELCDGMCRLGAKKKSPVFHLCVQAYIRANLNRIRHDEKLVAAFSDELRKHSYLGYVSDFYIYANLTREERYRFNKFFKNVDMASTLSMLRGSEEIVQFAENDSFTTELFRSGSSPLSKFEAAYKEGYVPFEPGLRRKASSSLWKRIGDMAENFIPGTKDEKPFLEDEGRDFPGLFGAIVVHNEPQILSQLYNGASPLEDVKILVCDWWRRNRSVCYPTILERALTMSLCDEDHKNVCKKLLSRALVLDTAKLNEVLRNFQSKKLIKETDPDFLLKRVEEFDPNFLPTLERTLLPISPRIEVERVSSDGKEEASSVTGGLEHEDKGKEEVGSGDLFLKPPLVKTSRAKMYLAHKVASSEPRAYEEREGLTTGESERWAVPVRRAQEDSHPRDHDVGVKKSKGCHCTIL